MDVIYLDLTALDGLDDTAVKAVTFDNFVAVAARATAQKLDDDDKADRATAVRDGEWTK